MVVSYHRPTKVIVDLAAIKENVAIEVKKQAGKRDIFAVVKANGYGHGAVPAAKAALVGGASGFCVATLDEGIALRESGITAPIIVLGIVEVAWLPLILEYHLAVPVATLSWLEEAALYMATQALTGQLLLHLTVDTGMGRIGFRDEAEILVAIEKIKENVNWVFEGIFTHFAT
ncbi:MAG: alanine racemase, partial [Enterococcus sp.]|nr:alanine racemase [Enterococcus sp.]